MSGVLDELRSHLEHLAIPMRMIAMQNTGVERAVLESELRDALDKFEADHPGLVDYSDECAYCCKPLDTRSAKVLPNPHDYGGQWAVCEACYELKVKP